MRECVTRFFGGRPGLSDFSELQLRYSTGLYTGFAFKPSHPGEWHQKSIYLVKSILVQVCLLRQVILLTVSEFFGSLNSETCPDWFWITFLCLIEITVKVTETPADFESAGV